MLQGATSWACERLRMVKEVKEKFQAWDLNGDGVIERGELAELLQALDAEAWTDDKIDALFAAADINSDTRIDYSELLNWVFAHRQEATTIFNAGAENSKVAQGSDISKVLEMSLLAVLQNAAAGNRCVLVRSKEDDACPTRMSFAEKPVVQEGDDVDFTDLGITFQCRKGSKPEALNANNFVVAHVEDIVSIYIVIDGHGSRGERVSNFVQEHLMKIILDDSRMGNADLKALLERAFSKTQQLIIAADKDSTLSAQLAGAQCLVVIHDRLRGQLTTGSVGKLTACVGQVALGPDKTEISAKPLMQKHEPYMKTEKKRIERSGGRVVFDGYACFRVYEKSGGLPGASMSRSLGDIHGHDVGMISDPSVSEHVLKDSDRFLLACTSGVSEFMTEAELVKFVHNNPREMKITKGATLAKAAWDRWIQKEGGCVVDDITFVCSRLPASPKVEVTLHATEAEGTQAISCLNLEGDVIFSSSLEAKLTVQELRKEIASALKLEPSALRMQLPSLRVLGWTDLALSVSDLLKGS